VVLMRVAKMATLESSAAAILINEGACLSQRLHSRRHASDLIEFDFTAFALKYSRWMHTL
jgi:hypothetical protein